MSVKPFSPDEALASKVTMIPDQVIDAVNTMLATNWSGRGRCSFTIKELSAMIRSKFGDADGDLHLHSSWFDFESIYEKAGWKVEFDRPGYNESYDAVYTFSRRGGL